MKKLLLSLTALLMMGQAQAQLAPAFTARLQTVLDSVCNKYHIRGVSAAVLMPGVGTWQGVHGVSSASTPMRSDMLLGMGSNTKTYISTLMLLLEEQGKLSVDDTIGKWITNQPHIAGSITIRQLLSHTSGLYDFTQHPDFQDSLFEDVSRIWQPEDMLQFVDSPYFAPGTKFDYCNTNYLLAGLIIKQVTHMPVGAALHQYILQPQGLDHTIFFPEDAPTDEVAHPWSYVGSGSYQEDLFDAYGYSNNAFFSMAYSAGAMMTTADDNAKFWHQLLSGGILQPASLAKMLTTVQMDPHSSDGYGLGIFYYPHYLNGHTMYSHGGTLVGYISENAVDSVTGVTITVLTNQDSIGNDRLSASVIKALHKVTLQMSPTDIREAQAQAAGVRCYPNPAQGTLYVTYSGKTDRPVFRLMDITGRIAATLPLSTGLNALSVAQLASGIYQAVLETADQGRLQLPPVEVQ